MKDINGFCGLDMPELNFTIRYIHKMHLKALAELDKII